MTDDIFPQFSPPECIKYGVGWRVIRRYRGETALVGPWGQTKDQARDLWDEMLKEQP